jgi:hypothetical protein
MSNAFPETKLAAYEKAVEAAGIAIGRLYADADDCRRTCPLPRPLVSAAVAEG